MTRPKSGAPGSNVSPMPLRKNLGTDVAIETEAMKPDWEANEVLHRIGKELIKQEPGMNYIGTICIHMYRENDAIIKNNYSLANITNIAMKEEISEQAVLVLWQNASIQIRQYFNPSFTHKSTDTKDQRGSIK